MHLVYFLAAFLISNAAFANEYNAGDACNGTPGAWHQKNDATGSYFLICKDDPTTDFYTKALDFTDSGLMKLPAINSVPCVAGLAGAINYSTTGSPVVQYCNGTSWVQWGSAPTVTGSPPSYSGPGGTAAGIQGEIQFNVNGTLLGGISQMFWNDSNSRLGFNTTTPSTILHIATASGQWTNGGLSFGGGSVGLYESASNTLAFRTNGSDQVFVNSTGVGIGKSPAVKLDVNGDINYSGTLVDTSDRRTKENIEPLQSSLEKINKLQPVSFTRIEEESGEIHFGLIAQDVQPIYPDIVHVKSAEGLLGVNYVGLIAPLIHSVQELSEENARLRERIEILEGKDAQ